VIECLARAARVKYKYLNHNQASISHVLDAGVIVWLRRLSQPCCPEFMRHDRGKAHASQPYLTAWGNRLAKHDDIIEQHEHPEQPMQP